MKPDELWRWANGVATRAEKAGRGTEFPTLRKAAKRFRCRYDEVEAAADEGSDLGYLGVAVAIRVGGGIGDIDRADWLIEAY